MAGIVAGEKATATRVNFEFRDIIARGRRVTASTGTTTIVGVERLDDIPVVTGRSYNIRATGMFARSTVASDRVLIEVRHTTDGSTPSTSSAVLPGGQSYHQANVTGTSAAHTRAQIDFEYEPGSDQTLSLLLTLARDLGTGTVDLFSNSSHALELKIYDSGPAVGDTGTDI